LRLQFGNGSNHEGAMPKQTHPETKAMQGWRKIALGYPEAEEGTSCNKSAFKARNKAFLFMGMDHLSYHAMVKLRDCLAEAAKLATKEPHRYAVGAGGWVKATFGRDESPPPGLLERWIDESYRLLVHKQLVAMLPYRGPPTADSTRTAKKKLAKKKAASG
jgi:YjbR